MRVARLCTRKHSGLDGEGAKLYGGRWNSIGRAVVYTASCSALAIVEGLANMRKFPANSVLLLIDIPDHIAIEKVAYVPADPKAFLRIGDEWLGDGKTALLRVPSVLAPRQWNLLLNPAHADFPAIKTIEQMPFAFDSRLLDNLS